MDLKHNMWFQTNGVVLKHRELSEQQEYIH